MIEQNPSLVKFLRELQRVPYLASKNLYLVAQYFLDSDEKSIEQFCSSLKDLKTNMLKCQTCWTWKEKNSNCIFCFSPKRDKLTICVVQTWRDLIAIEKAGGYNGVYHILGGAICPLDGIGPQDLTINHLVERVKAMSMGSDSAGPEESISQCKELILALNQTPEGEATSVYISSKLKDTKVKISCLARGLPVGSVLEAMDRLTLSKALSERRPF